MNKLSFIAALGFGTVFTAPVWALDCQRADCTALGYTDKETDTTCTKFVRCPFDSKAVLCIQHKTEAACDVGYKKTVAECGTIAFGSYKLGAAQASNAACKKCEITCNTNYTLSNGVCSKPKTCADRISEAKCKRFNDGDTISGNLTNLEICLFGTVTQASGYNSSLTLDNTIVYDAGKRFPECEAEMKGRAKLVAKGSVSMKNYIRFYCDVSMDYVSFRPNGGTWYADFYGNTDIRVDYRADSYWSSILRMYFFGDDSTGERTTNRVFIQCEQTSTSNRWSEEYCEVEINADTADVSYGGESIGGMCTEDSYSSSYCSGIPSIECYEDYDATCKEDLNYYNW